MNEFEPGKLPSEIDWNKYPSDLGVTHELCAGIVDKNLSLVEIMHEEILEECGYDCPVDKISKITSFRLVSINIHNSFINRTVQISTPPTETGIFR